jgi:cytochrome c-type biogenesis protein CcmI
MSIGWFWMMLVAAVLSAAVMLLISGRRQREQQRTRLDVNRDLYEQRVAELTQEVRDGYLTEQAAQRSRNELDRRFIEENSALEQVHDQRVSGGLWVIALLVMVIGAVDPSEEKLRRSKVKAPLVLPRVSVEPAAPEMVVVPELNPSPPPSMVLVKVRFTPAARVIGPCKFRAVALLANV